MVNVGVRGERWGVADPVIGEAALLTIMNTETLTDEILPKLTDATRDAAHQVSDTVKEACHTMSNRVEDTVLRAKGYVQQNPLPVVVGSLVLGAAIGCLVAVSRRQSLKERFTQDPVNTAREILYAALEPMGRRLDHGVDAVSDGAERAVRNVRDYMPFHSRDSWGRQMVRHLRFW